MAKAAVPAGRSILSSSVGSTVRDLSPADTVKSPIVAKSVPRGRTDARNTTMSGPATANKPPSSLRVTEGVDRAVIKTKNKLGSRRGRGGRPSCGCQQAHIEFCFAREEAGECRSCGSREQLQLENAGVVRSVNKQPRIVCDFTGNEFFSPSLAYDSQRSLSRAARLSEVEVERRQI